VKAVDEDGKMIAFFTAKEGMEFTCPHPELEQKIRRITADGRLFVGDGIAVDPSLREGLHLRRKDTCF